MNPTLQAFGGDPWWVMIVKALVIFVFLVGMALFLIVAERRVLAFMGMRVGPNRVGPKGTLQSVADGIKLALKEDIVPQEADRPIYILAPVISTVPAMLALAVIPFGPVVSIGGLETPLQLADLPVAVLFLLGMSSLGIYGIVLGGWASGSTYPLLGGLRSAAQMISYEIAMGLSFVAVFLFAGSLSTSQIVASQDIWYAAVLFPSFAVYLISMVGETNRAPFDLPEAEGELVAGFHTEYSSLKFAMFFLAEYINMVTVSAIATTLFLGGWRAPWPIGAIWEGANGGGWPVLWFLLKLFALLFVFMWLRGTLPRLRYDQFMHLGWKVLIPVSLGWILLVATVRALTNVGIGRTGIIVGGIVLAVGVLVGTYVYEFIADRKRRAVEAAQVTQTEKDRAADTDLTAGGHPVPPMDAPHYHGVPRDDRARKEPPEQTADQTNEQTSERSPAGSQT